jgi:uncharacterized protein
LQRKPKSSNIISYGEVILTFLSLQNVCLVTVPALAGYLAAAIVLALLVRSLIEPHLLDVVHVKVCLPDQGQPARFMPPDTIAPGIRILLLSDLHVEKMFVPARRLLAGCRTLKPDLILFAGDLSSGRACTPAAIELFRKIASLPENNGCPFFAVRGNHDDPEAADALRSAGFPVLENDAAVINVRGVDWLIMGLGDLVDGHANVPLALERAERLAVRRSHHLVLAHNPDALLSLPEGEAGLFLSGHLHGGQIWMPFNLEFHLLRHEKLPRIGHIRGSFIWRGVPAYTSRGLGCVIFPLRLFSKPEITFIDIM